MTIRSIRAALAADPSVGAGNVLPKLLEHGASPDEPGLTFDVDVDGHPAWVGLTLGQVSERVAARAAWLSGRGIGHRDPVAVYVSTSADCLLTFLALTWLGAIPALMNPNLTGEIAAEYLGRLRARALVTDTTHRDRLAGVGLLTSEGRLRLAGGDPTAGGGRTGSDPTAGGGDWWGIADVPVFDAADLGTGDPAAAPEHYRHHADDPIAITHSSGTTRLPAAVVHSQESLFAATRIIRLSGPRAQGTDRILSVLPAAHAAGIMTLNHALSNRSELLFLSESGGEAVLSAIARWRATGVFGFAATWPDLVKHDLSQYDLDSVALWFNTADCAHENHIRALVAVGSRDTVTRGGIVRRRGSHFVDGIGSTEMGHSAFHVTHSIDTNRYGRCVGRPHVFADIALLDTTTGVEVPVGRVGHCGLKSPTLAPGYWNDSAATYRTRSGGYYLTGDLMYRDEDGYYYHVDRAVDAVDLGDGDWLYTAMSEERILRACPDLRDCTVVSTTVRGAVVTDVLLIPHAGTDPHIDRTDAVRSAFTEAAARTLRQVVLVSDDQLILGPTGKVRKFLMRQRHIAETAVAQPEAMTAQPAATVAR